ncbi:tol-pal system-associated acyl-CoA thioesterase [Fluviibacterium sp. DFM31]|uniref:Tol-pal system-associated acyl-CoA thioesterase n=1 Tax=Meridianimarinicoccus marinus TaxID=3231483 RepID=A0ABV3L0Z6_9RHOB
MTQTADQIQIRVYYEDTDLAGIVYYANYLKFIERGRTEFLRTRGVDQGAYKAQTGVVFAARRVEADYLAPAVFDDLLTVETRLSAIRGARIFMTQTVLRDGDTLFRAQVTLAAMTEDGKPTRVPADLCARLDRVLE